MIDFGAFEVMSFDCYGTLIDWEAGLARALSPIFKAHGVEWDEERALSDFAECEAEAERGPYMTYREVLSSALRGVGTRRGFAPSAAELDRFSGSVGEWPPFPDSSAALQRLHERYRLAVITNCDDDLFAQSSARLGVMFDWVITAQQVRSYKPSPNNFHQAIARIGVPRGHLLHVAQSIFHDHVPARHLGLTSVWVNRRHDRPGTGATPAAEAAPDLEVPDMATLAQIAVSR